MKKPLMILSLLMMSAGPAMAAPMCYTPAQLQAEQLLRLHSELMVITVTCAQSSGGENLVPMYTGFTRTNLHNLHEAEQTMAHYYQASYGGSGMDALDKLRTRLGNEFGQKIADMSAPSFCAQYRDKVVMMYSQTPQQVNDETLRMVQNEKSEHPLCDSKATRIAKGG